jgi:hypothetical protein
MIRHCSVEQQHGFRDGPGWPDSPPANGFNLSLDRVRDQSTAIGVAEYRAFGFGRRRTASNKT